MRNRRLVCLQSYFEGDNDSDLCLIYGLDCFDYVRDDKLNFGAS